MFLRAGYITPQQVQENATAAPEAADGPGEQAEGGDGRAPAETRQRAGESEEQFLNGRRETVQEAPGHHGERGEPIEGLNQEMSQVVMGGFTGLMV